jgi:hypothetical protein
MRLGPSDNLLGLLASEGSDSDPTGGVCCLRT